MNIYHSYIISRKMHKLEFLVQALSIIQQKEINPENKFILITDKKSELIYKRNGLIELYDEVITDLFDDYPYDRIAKLFWSSPKMWAIKKLKTPFLMMDTDLIMHIPLDGFKDCKLGYLHKETSTSYPQPYQITMPDDWEFSFELLFYIRNSLPINGCLLYFGNEEFKNEFTDLYFKFVLDNEGKFINVHQNLLDSGYINNSGGVMFAEQHFLGALAEKWNMNEPNFKMLQVHKALYNSYCFNGIDNDAETTEPYFYHLWGGKAHIEDQREMLTINTKLMLKAQGLWEKYKKIYYRFTRVNKSKKKELISE